MIGKGVIGKGFGDTPFGWIAVVYIAQQKRLPITYLTYRDPNWEGIILTIDEGIKGLWMMLMIA